MVTTTDSAASIPLQQHQEDVRFSCNICLEALQDPVVTQCGHLYCWPCLYQWLAPGMTGPERATLGGSSSSSPFIDGTRRACPVCKSPCSVPTLVPIYVRNKNNSPQKANVSAAVEDNELDQDSVGSNNSSSQKDEKDSAPSTGLRQRLRFRSRDSEIPASEDQTLSSPPREHVPPRPPAQSPTREELPAINNSSLPMGMTLHPGLYRASSTGASVSLSHVLAHSLQRALQQQQQQPMDPESIPPIHRSADAPPPMSVANPVTASEVSVATEFLSRILLMLGSFVILCLLLF
jgi:RING-type zinc-finger